MASMSTDLAVLRALLFFSRRRAPATFDDLLHRLESSDCDADDIRRALGSLARAQLVQRIGASARLTLPGLAVACAAAANARRAKTVARPARVLPMIRRRRHAA